MKKIESLRRYNQDVYEAIAPSFDRTRQRPWPELDDIMRQVGAGQRLLDLGCGNARLLKALPSVNFDYLGIDSNEYLLSAARQQWPRHTFERRPLETLQLARNTFDHIFCVAAFHHLASKEDRWRFLRQCRQALAPGGRLIITVWRLWQFRYLKYGLAQIRRKVSWRDLFIPWKADGQVVWRYYHAFTSLELRWLLHDAGFKEYQLSRKGDNYLVVASA